MNQFDINRINIFSLYNVWESHGRFYFETDYALKYFMDFELDDNPRCTAYWFNLVNMRVLPRLTIWKYGRQCFVSSRSSFVVIPMFCYIFVVQLVGSKLSELVYLLVGLIEQNSRSVTFWKLLRWKGKSIMPKNMWLLSYPVIILMLMIFWHGLTRKRLCSIAWSHSCWLGSIRHTCFYTYFWVSWQWHVPFEWEHWHSDWEQWHPDCEHEPQLQPVVLPVTWR